MNGEERVRVDIATAVQMSLFLKPPYGMCELLMESNPVELDPLGGPLPGVVETACAQLEHWRAKWRARAARQARMQVTGQDRIEAWLQRAALLLSASLIVLTVWLYEVTMP